MREYIDIVLRWFSLRFHHISAIQIYSVVQK